MSRSTRYPMGYASPQQNCPATTRTLYPPFRIQCVIHLHELTPALMRPILALWILTIIAILTRSLAVTRLALGQARGRGFARYRNGARHDPDAGLPHSASTQPRKRNAGHRLNPRHFRTDWARHFRLPHGSRAAGLSRTRPKRAPDRRRRPARSRPLEIHRHNSRCSGARKISDFFRETIGRAYYAIGWPTGGA